MILSRLVPTLLAMVALAGVAAADDSGNFLYTLGQDTTAVDHYTRSATKLELDQAGRAPRTLRRHYVIDYANGSVTHASITATPPGATAPVQSIDATFAPDSMRMKITGANGQTSLTTVKVPPDAIVLPGGSPWSCYEPAIMKLAAGKSDSLRSPLYLLGAGSMNVVSFHKLGKDSVDVFNDHLDHYHAKIDKTGHVLGVLPIAGTQKFAVQRLASLDVDAYANNWMAREKSGTGLGVLSPRDSVKVTAGGASLFVDYGRPSKRGRPVWGGLVPYGEVWRTGANAATQFRTDKALNFNGTVVPAGFYTLWTMQTAGACQLIINSETGQWGTEHKADKDLFKIDMKLSTLPSAVEKFLISVDPSAGGGTLNLDWDTTRESVAFTVQP